MTPKVEFIVPTLKRVEFLKLCLDSLLCQTVVPTRILVGVRHDDIESIQVVDSYLLGGVIERVDANGIGVIGSMTSCLKKAHGDFIGLVDDDVELPPHWTETMLKHLEENPDVVGCAGRDLLQDHPEMRRAEPLTPDVGRIHWHGRITGNHHCGCGLARKVQVLRGSNILFQSRFLCEAGFDQGLRGQGAQVNWELGLAYQAAAQTRSLFYDPAVEVIHHTAPRHDKDLVHRGIFNEEGISDMSFNETWVALRHASQSLKIRVIAWQCLIGTSQCPGLAHAIVHIVRRNPHLFSRVKAVFKGRRDAWLAAN